MRKKEWVVLTSTFKQNAAGRRVELDSAIAKILYAKKMAVPYVPKPAPVVREPEPEVSPRTGKPKRKYRRRDMRAED